MVLLRRTWLSLSILTSLGELLGLLTNFCRSSQHTSLNRLAWGLFQYTPSSPNRIEFCDRIYGPKTVFFDPSSCTKRKVVVSNPISLCMLDILRIGSFRCILESFLSDLGAFQYSRCGQIPASRPNIRWNKVCLFITTGFPFQYVSLKCFDSAISKFIGDLAGSRRFAKERIRLFI